MDWFLRGSPSSPSFLKVAPPSSTAVSPSSKVAYGHSFLEVVYCHPFLNVASPSTKVAYGPSFLKVVYYPFAGLSPTSSSDRVSQVLSSSTSAEDDGQPYACLCPCLQCWHAQFFFPPPFGVGSGF